jgi:uroporphyrinogen decarboxylase
MNSDIQTRLLKTLAHDQRNCPLFFPGIYDYKAAFSNTPPHLFGQDEADLVAAMESEIAHIQADMVICAYDIYNIEAEALGCHVIRKPGQFPSIARPILDSLCTDNLPHMSEPQKRIALFLRATEAIHRRYGQQLQVFGAVSGPFSLAGRLYPQDRLLMDCLCNAQGVHGLMRYCTELIRTIVSCYGRRGIPVVLFDSLAAPPLVSPDIYECLILPYHQSIFQCLIDLGVVVRPLIIGGDTLAILDLCQQSGANLLLLDYTIAQERLPALLGIPGPCAWRINLSPQLVAEHTPQEIACHTQGIMTLAQEFGNVVVGTGILAPNTPLDHIQAIRKTISSADPTQRFSDADEKAC